MLEMGITHKNFRPAQWARTEVWEELLSDLSKPADCESVSIDASYIKVHQHGTGAKGGASDRR